MSGLGDFIGARMLITTDDTDAFLRARGVRNPRTSNRMLAALCASGNLVRIQRGVYAQSGTERCGPDPYVVASHLAPDAILGLHTALEVRGLVAPTTARCVYFTRLASGRTRGGPVWDGMRMYRITHPVALARAGKKFLETEMLEGRGGIQMRVTTIERAFVDLMGRPRLAGDWPAVLRMLDAIATLDLDRVIRYAGSLGNATTAAIAGWFLERNQERLGVTPAVLCRLEHLRPREIGRAHV
jgi:predicted transcriptional regulator of viral defense system